MPATAKTYRVTNRGMAVALLRAELQRLGRGDLPHLLCFSDAAWRSAMATVGCPAYIARLASPTARRGTRGKLGMATICHLRHQHPGVVYIRTHGRTWPEIAETVRHEALHLARPSYSHRQVDVALGHKPKPVRRRRRVSPVGSHALLDRLRLSADGEAGAAERECPHQESRA